MRWAWWLLLCVCGGGGGGGEGGGAGERVRGLGGRESERESVCVCVCERERESSRILHSPPHPPIPLIVTHSKGASSLETPTGNFSKSVSLWTRTAE